MANIQERLRTQRYSIQQIRLPQYSSLPKTTKTFTNKYGGKDSILTDLSIKVMNLYIKPPKTDKYYLTNHKQIIDDYIIYSKSNIRHYRYITLNKLIIPLVYYIINNNQYNSTFEYYGIAWTNNVLWCMRKYIIQMKYDNKVFDRVSPCSNMYYPLVKPMKNNAVGELRDSLYDLLIDIAFAYIKHHKLVIK